ncbi:protein THEM6-like [Leguminivora glycinivorella]|uniref:protein THEM6-like n=1 Tax=Leguminivora glycinivorella TaxID=1035111 RepID=UPI0020108E3B|nr:protein THEM6-like [Leguminivora glycinivorella]
MYSVIITIIVILLLVWDVGYYFRAYLVVFFGRLFQRRFKINETTVLYGICTTRDVDIFFTHMNNARYLRALDFSRIHFYDRTGLYEKLAAVKGAALMGASTIRYRRPLDIFSLYKVETKMLCWDEKTIFLEHKFITLKDNFVRAIVFSRTHIVGLDLPTAMAYVPEAHNMKTFPEEVVQWQQCLETASARLRKKD